MSFVLGAVVPVLCMMLSSDWTGPLVTTIVSTAMLAALGAIAAHLGGCPEAACHGPAGGPRSRLNGRHGPHRAGRGIGRLSLADRFSGGEQSR